MRVHQGKNIITLIITMRQFQRNIKI